VILDAVKLPSPQIRLLEASKLAGGVELCMYAGERMVDTRNSLVHAAAIEDCCFIPCSSGLGKLIHDSFNAVGISIHGADTFCKVVDWEKREGISPGRHEF
jgi:hypothetical protein